MNFYIDGPCYEKSPVCEFILRALPAWFGIEQAIQQYAAEINSLPTFLAVEGDLVTGFISIKQHSPWSAEIYVMGVLPDWHRQGIGRALVEQAQGWLKADGIEYLQVKTLGYSSFDRAYARTRAFYAAAGFRPLEEFKQIWDEHNPCLIMIKYL